MKVFNVYGYNTCGNDSICLAGLWTQAGMKAAPARAVGHCISQVFYDGAWHLLRRRPACRLPLAGQRDGGRRAGLTRDHDLIKRTHTYGILLPDEPQRPTRTRPRLSP